MSLGLDISDRKLRLVALSKRKDKATVVAASEVDLPAGIISDGEIIQADQVKDYLQKLLHDVRPKKRIPKEVVACLPERKSFIKVITISDDEINKDSIYRELKNHLPYALDEVYFDWQKLDGNKVLVGASFKTIVDSYLSVLSTVNLIGVALEIESVAIVRALLPSTLASAAPIIVIDIGRSRSTFILYDKNTIYFTSSTNKFCGSVLASSIQEKLKISPKEANALMQKVGYDQKNWSGKIEIALLTPLDELIDIINQISNFYCRHYQNTYPVGKILITGGGAKTPNLARAISTKANIACQVVVPKVQVNNKASKYVNDQTIYSYATAIGLALRAMDQDDHP